MKQHSIEIFFFFKLKGKQREEKIFTTEGLKTTKVSSDEGSALRTSMGLSWNRYRKQRQYFCQIGVEMDCEREEGNFQEDALCGKFTEEDVLLHHED